MKQFGFVLLLLTALLLVPAKSAKSQYYYTDCTGGECSIIWSAADEDGACAYLCCKCYFYCPASWPRYCRISDCCNIA